MKVVSRVPVFFGGLGLSLLLTLGGCASMASLQDALKPTAIEKVDYKPTAKPAWKGKTIFVDFDYSSVYWRYDFAANLSQQIRDSVIEGLVEDKIFKVQDRVTAGKYFYRVEIRIASPVIKLRSGSTIDSISATFRIKIYDASNNLITAKTRDVRYDAPMLTVSVNNSQQTLLDNYIHNAGEEIRKTFYESL